MKKYLFTILTLFAAIFFFAYAHIAAAAATPTVAFVHVPASIAQQQQFYVDVTLSTDTTSINGVQGTVTFPVDKLSFIRAETGTSNVILWIDPPTAKGNTVTFSGIIPGGFNGLIDPFDQSHKLPGEIVRLVFAGRMPGNAVIATSNVSVTENDGNGTLDAIADAQASVDISSAIAPSLYTTPDTIPPSISASVVSDKNLFDGKYTLIFNTSDKESGIDHVALQEGSDPQVFIQSPYLLHDQSRHSILSLRAYDVAGNAATITIAPLASPSPVLPVIILILLVFIILYVIYKKTKRKKITV